MHIYTEVFEGLRVFFVFLTGLLNVYSHHEVKKVAVALFNSHIDMCLLSTNLRLFSDILCRF
jgi:hypothetical protein